MKTQKRLARMRVVKELMALGFSIPGIASVLDVPESTVANDWRVLGGVKQFPNRPKYSAKRLDEYRGQIFQNAVKRYAALAKGFNPENGEEPDRELRAVLANWLKLSNIFSFVSGARAAMGRLMRPQVPSDQENYVLLLRAIFGERPGLASEYQPVLTRVRPTTLRGYFVSVANGSIPVPPNREAIALALMEPEIAESRGDIAPIWPSNAIAIVDQALAMLVEREAEVIRLRFGLPQGRKLTREEVGKRCGVTRERIRQIEAKALRKLRAPHRSRQLITLLLPVGNLLARPFDG